MLFRSYVSVSCAAIFSFAGPVTANATVSYLHRDKTTIAGHRIEIDHVGEIDAKCKSVGVPALKLVVAPTHGRVSSERQNMFPIYPASGPRAICNTRKSPITVIYYTPDREFVGHDAFEIDISYTDGLLRDTKVDVQVR